MQALLEPLSELASFEGIKQRLKQHKKVMATGCVDSQKVHMLAGLSEGFRNKVIITFSDSRVKEISEDLELYDRNVIKYPAKDLIFYQADIHGNDLTRERIRCLKRIMEGKPYTLVTTFDSLMAPQIPLDVYADAMVEIKKRSEIDISKLTRQLIDMGYEKVYQVEASGQFSVRGGIVDIFDLTEENPFRMELWGDEVESIRSFDILSQRSIENLERVCIYPAAEIIMDEDRLEKGIKEIEKDAKKQGEALQKEFLTEEAHRLKIQVAQFLEQVSVQRSYVNLDAYMKYFYEDTVSLLSIMDETKTLLVLDEPMRIEEHVKAVELEFRESMSHRVEKGYLLPKQMELLLSKQQVCAWMEDFGVLSLSALDGKNPIIHVEERHSFSAFSMPSYNNSFESLVNDLKKYKKNGYRVLLLSASKMRAKRLAEDLRDQELAAVYTEDPYRYINPGEIVTYYGKVIKGFEYPQIKYVVIAETDIFGGVKKKKKKKKTYSGQAIQSFQDLKIGDYVVHENHGLGIYQGIEKVEVDKVVKDYIKIQYRDGGNLYILATGLDVIQKYASSEGRTPKLNKLGTSEWNKTKSKVRSSVGEIAKDLVELYANRQKQQGYRFSEDTVWQKEFEELFPFEETEDQLTAIAETKKDMESGKIMDRLICGDVGYGKTEIAIRAAFKAVSEGKQVVYLVPTTILAQQHFNTFSQRMKDFPIRVDLLCRFRTAKEQKKTIEDLKKGFVDIVIGTHRVLSKDVEFKDIGLLIIDEEQRFGVTHKEKIKHMKENIDVLTLTATPIPRTLHMSLIGIRDMSILEEPPQDRLPIQTYVMEYNEEMVREAIVRELSRSGQVYYVYNRVNNIADIAASIQKLVPEATVSFAHGQMREQELERIMYDFINGEIDVLVSTTIIETGLDISNVNTMIIHDSDQLGLSQLYQLRGRVGRSNRTSYAFLMYKRDKMLKEIAEKRLQAIREFTELGSGFKIAMRDLEIRGAGNLLGREQHGNMEAVGYDLYCKMLNEAVKKEQGVEVIEDFTTTIDLFVDAFIPPSYIVNEVQKLDIYKRIAGIETVAESEDMKDELMDRFGAIPKSVQNLLRIALIRARAHGLYFMEVKGKEEKIQMTFIKEARIQPERIPPILKKFKDNLTFTAYEGTPYFTYRFKKSGIIEKDGDMLLENVEMLLDTFEKELIC